MSISKGKTSKAVTKTLAAVLSLAMVVTSLTVTGTTSDAAKKGKVKKVKITSPVTNGGKLVLKKGQKKRIKVKVTTSKKSVSKKVTYKTSNKKVAKVVKKKGKYYVKATGKKGSAKITVISKANKKKKATLKVKIGKPIKKVSVSKVTYSTNVYNKLTRRTKTTTRKTSYSSKTGVVLQTGIDNTANETSTTYTCKISVKFSPKKPSYKSMKWSTKNNSVAYVTPSGIISPRKAGTATIVGKTKDGSNKTVKVKVTVKSSAKGPTATPYFVKDTRKKTMVENFESYAVGTSWRLTKGEKYKNAKTATATVVTDPQNSKNKLLRISYDGNTQAYDVAPIFSVDLTKLKDATESTKLEDFVGLNFKVKVEGSGDDLTYKTVYGYFDKYGAINENYYNATSQTAKGPYYKFKTSRNMMKGTDKEINDPITGKKYNFKSFPMFYSAYATGDKEAVSAGFSETKNDKNLRMVEHVLEFQPAYMKDEITGASLLGESKVDFTLGSTYKGAYVNGNFVNLYLDDIQFLSETETREISGINFTNAPDKLGTGISYPLHTSLVPANTTQKKLKFASSDEKIAKVGEETGIVTGVSAGKVTITATSAEKPSVKKTVEIEIYESGTAKEDKKIDLSKITERDDKKNPKTFTNTETSYNAETGELKIGYTKTNSEQVVIDLGEGVDFTQYKSLEIVGATSGQLSLELYDSGLDMTDEKWYEKYEGATYPFFGGSCASRLEDGAYNTNAVDMTTETLWYSWDDLTDDGTSDKAGCDFRAIRYIVLKANQDPIHPAKYDMENYIIKSITLDTKEAPEDYLPITLTAENELKATSQTENPDNKVGHESAVFDKDEKGNPFVTFTSNSRRNSGIAFYLNAEKQSATDISRYRYVKVKVNTDNRSDKLSLVGVKDGSDWSAAVSKPYKTEGTVTQNERTIYFSIKDQTEEELSALEAIGIKSSFTGSKVTITSMELVKGEPLILDEDAANTTVLK